MKKTTKKLLTIAVVCVLLVTALLGATGCAAAPQRAETQAAVAPAAGQAETASKHVLLATQSQEEMQIVEYEFGPLSFETEYTITVPGLTPENFFDIRFYSGTCTYYHSKLGLQSVEVGINGRFTEGAALIGENTYKLNGWGESSDYEYKYYSNFFNVRGWVRFYVPAVPGPTPIPLPENPTKAGHTFVGWYFDAELSQPYDGREIVSDTVLYAKFAITHYTITFNTNGGVSIEPLARDYGATLSNLPIPTRAGYVFKGWKLNGVAYTGGTVTGNMTLVATWEEILYKVTFMVEDTIFATIHVPAGTTLKNVAQQLAAELSGYVTLFDVLDDDQVTEDITVYGAFEEKSGVEKWFEKTLQNIKDFFTENWVVIVIVAAAVIAIIILIVIFTRPKKRIAKRGKKSNKRRS